MSAFIRNHVVGLFSLLLCDPVGAGDLKNIEPVLTKIADLLFVPTDIQAAPDGSNRLFLVDINGHIRILDLDTNILSPVPFLEVPDVQLKVGLDEERGCYSMAFHPDFATNGHFYVHHSIVQFADFAVTGNRIARFTANSPSSADPDSRMILIETVKYENYHYGGQICFGPDGFLYIAIGDDEQIGGNPQSPYDFMGKILRIDVDDPPEGANYGIPPGNPVLTSGFGLDEVLMMGLRNPWKISFDRQTGDLYIADVGEDSWEEINMVPSGTSYDPMISFGWNFFEANSVFMDGADPGEHQAPIFAYAHPSPTAGRSITGGYVYRGTRYPRMQGVYFYADWSTATIYGLEKQGEVWTSRELSDDPDIQLINTFGEGPDGELYVAISNRIYHFGDTLVGTLEPPSISGLGINESGYFYIVVTTTSEGGSLQLERADEPNGPWEPAGAPVAAGSAPVTLMDLEEAVPAEGHPRRFYHVTLNVGGP